MDKDKIINYILKSPYNTNITVLNKMLGEDLDEDRKEKLFKYVSSNTNSMNQKVLETLLVEQPVGEVLYHGKNLIGKEGGLDITLSKHLSSSKPIRIEYKNLLINDHKATISNTLITPQPNNVMQYTEAIWEVQLDNGESTYFSILDQTNAQYAPDRQWIGGSNWSADEIKLIIVD